MITIQVIYRAMGALLLFFYNIFNNYGLAILAFGLFVKLILLPFQMKSKHSMMRSTMLTPRIKELEKKYATTNKQKYQEEVARLYKDAKVNPMSGCLWSLLPFPLLILLYQAVRQPLTFLMSLASEQITTLTETLSNMGLYTIPARVDAYSQMTIANILHKNFADVVANPGVAEFADKLKDINFNFLTMNLSQKPQPFFWNFTEEAGTAGIVSAFLLFLIPLVSAALSLLQSKVSMAMTPAQDEKSASASKSMTMMMPLMSIWICFIMPAVMGIYWIEQSVLAIIQESILNKHYKGKLDAEMAEFNAAEKAREEELERKRAETERLRAEGKTTTNENTSKRRLAAQEKAASELRQAAYRAAERAAKGLEKEIPPSQVGNRIYARGRAYDPNRYADEGLDASAAAEPAEGEPSAEDK